MHNFRRLAMRMAVGVLLAQLGVVASLAIVPVFCCEPAIAPGSALPDCCKGDGHSCPLKKLSAAADNDDDGGSRMRGCTASDERMASLLFGAAGVLVSLDPLPTPALVAVLESGDMYQSQRLSPADSPPPRA